MRSRRVRFHWISGILFGGIIGDEGVPPRRAGFFRDVFWAATINSERLRTSRVGFCSVVRANRPSSRDLRNLSFCEPILRAVSKACCRISSASKVRPCASMMFDRTVCVRAVISSSNGAEFLDELQAASPFWNSPRA